MDQTGSFPVDSAFLYFFFQGLICFLIFGNLDPIGFFLVFCSGFLLCPEQLRGLGYLCVQIVLFRFQGKKIFKSGFGQVYPGLQNCQPAGDPVDFLVGFLSGRFALRVIVTFFHFSDGKVIILLSLFSGISFCLKGSLYHSFSCCSIHGTAGFILLPPLGTSG